MIGNVLAIVLAVSMIFPATAQAGNEALFQDVKSAAWAIYVRNVGGMQAICSATAYATDAMNTKLLTAAHCFVGAELKKTDFLVTQDHKTFVKATLTDSGLTSRRMAKPTSTDMEDYEGNDWAVVTAEVGNQAVLSLGDSRLLAIGEDLIIVGLPFGMDFLAVQGIVGSLDLNLSKLPWNHYMGGNIFIAGGNSGSGVVSVKQKAVVGIVVAGPGSQSSLMIFTPISLVIEWLTR